MVCDINVNQVITKTKNGGKIPFFTLFLVAYFPYIEILTGLQLAQLVLET